MKTYSESFSTAFGEFFAGKHYLSTAAGYFTAWHGEEIDPLYQYLDLQTLIDKLSNRLADTYSIQSVRFRAADYPFFIENHTCGSCADSNEIDLPLEFQSHTLGTLTLCRGNRFSKRESRALASEAHALGGPCNNALLYAQACYTACHDELTGLFNRSVLKSPLHNPLAHSKHESLILLVCDIDRFKLINDNHGHAVGDAVLRRFAAKLQSIISDDGIVVRYGGDEFVITTSNAHAESVWTLGERLRQSIECCRLDIEGKSIELTTTIGVTTWRQEEPIENAILRADNALLQGKRAGRNKVVWLQGDRSCRDAAGRNT